MEWQNNYFRICGSATSLKIIQKVNGAVAIPVDHDKVLLIKIRRSDGKEYLEFPRGFSNSNETYEETAVRELNEETGLRNPRLIRKLGIVMPDSGLLTTKVGLVQIDVNLKQKIELQKAEKIVSYKVMSIEKLKSSILEGKVIDGFTIAACCQLVF